MKKTTKRGFTIVELVIVIAVIAILAAVMIPTFSGVIQKANDSAFRQEARNAFMENYDSKNAEADFIYADDDGNWAAVQNGQFVMDDGEIKIFASEAAAQEAAAGVLTTGKAYLNTTVVDGLSLVTIVNVAG